MNTLPNVSDNDLSVLASGQSGVLMPWREGPGETLCRTVFGRTDAAKPAALVSRYGNTYKVQLFRLDGTTPDLPPGPVNWSRGAALSFADKRLADIGYRLVDPQHETVAGPWVKSDTRYTRWSKGKAVARIDVVGGLSHFVIWGPGGVGEVIGKMYQSQAVFTFVDSTMRELGWVLEDAEEHPLCGAV